MCVIGMSNDAATLMHLIFVSMLHTCGLSADLDRSKDSRGGVRTASSLRPSVHTVDACASPRLHLLYKRCHSSSVMPVMMNSRSLGVR